MLHWGLQAHDPKKQQKVVGGWHSLLHSTDICQPDLLAQVVYYLPGAHIRHNMERLPRLIQYYPMLHIHVGTRDTARGNLGQIKSDNKALGTRVKRMGAQSMVKARLGADGSMHPLAV